MFSEIMMLYIHILMRFFNEPEVELLFMLPKIDYCCDKETETSYIDHSAATLQLDLQ